MEGPNAAREDTVILVGQLARRDLALYGLDFDWSSMFVAARYHNNVFAFQSQVARVDIG
jgi:hypothetical protein